MEGMLPFVARESGAVSVGPISAFRQRSGVARQQKKGNILSFFFTSSPATAGVTSTHQSVGPFALTTTLAVECLLRVLTKRPRFFIIIALTCPSDGTNQTV